MKPGMPDNRDERYVIGQWFDSVAKAVQAYPLRAGTETAKVLHYDRSKVSLSGAFNVASKGGRSLSRLEQASAGRHVYTMGARSKDADASAVSHMQTCMKRLYTVCKRNGVGVGVHTPKPGLVQISLAPQIRPTLQPAPRLRKMKFQM